MIGRSFQLTSIGLILLYLQLCSGRCPTSCDSNVKNIDVNELAGRWYVAAASPVRQTVSKCIYFDVIVNGSNSFKMNFTSAKFSNSRTVSWSVVGQKTENELSEFWQMNGSPNIFGPFFQKMLAMD
ncbi:GSCOCG00005288001-RA-CDS, partial [Cotesia congregata]